MQLEHQVCNLELSKKLKELGVPQESSFVWYNLNGGLSGEPRYDLKFRRGDNPEYSPAAFTDAELGEMLPPTVSLQSKGERVYYHLSGGKKWQDKKWAYMYTLAVDTKDKQRVGNEWQLTYQWADTEADARAKMLIYLLENNLITL